MYSEMTFCYNNKVYEVYLSGGADENILVLASNGVKQEFYSREEFLKGAVVDGSFLKDVWFKATNINYMG